MSAVLEDSRQDGEDLCYAFPACVEDVFEAEIVTLVTFVGPYLKMLTMNFHILEFEVTEQIQGTEAISEAENVTLPFGTEQIQNRTDVRLEA